MARLAVKTVDPALTRDDIVQLVAEIGSAQRELAEMQAESDQKLAEIRTVFEGRAKPVNELIERRLAVIAGWCAANRESLLGDSGRKSVNLGSGEVGWRTNPPKVMVRGEDDVIKALQTLGLARLLRTSTEIDKPAVLRESPETIAAVAGLSVAAGEVFWVRPLANVIETPELTVAVKPAKPGKGR